MDTETKSHWTYPQCQLLYSISLCSLFVFICILRSHNMQQISDMATPFVRLLNQQTQRQLGQLALECHSLLLLPTSQWIILLSYLASRTYQQFSFFIAVKSDCLLRAMIISSVSRAIVKRHQIYVSKFPLFNNNKRFLQHKQKLFVSILRNIRKESHPECVFSRGFAVLTADFHSQIFGVSSPTARKTKNTTARVESIWKIAFSGLWLRSDLTLTFENQSEISSIKLPKEI